MNNYPSRLLHLTSVKTKQTNKKTRCKKTSVVLQYVQHSAANPYRLSTFCQSAGLFGKKTDILQEDILEETEKKDKDSSVLVQYKMI